MYPPQARQVAQHLLAFERRATDYQRDTRERETSISSTSCCRTHGLVRSVDVRVVDGDDEVGDILSLFHECERQSRPPFLLV